MRSYFVNRTTSVLKGFTASEIRRRSIKKITKIKLIGFVFGFVLIVCLFKTETKRC